MKHRELGVIDLLTLFGFNKNCKSKLVRHLDTRKRYDVHDLLRRGWLEAYQSFQPKPIFHGVDYVVSFIGTGKRQARLVGVYRVLGHKPGHQGIIPPGCPYVEWKDSAYFYELASQTQFQDLQHRVVVDWGLAAQSWHQWTTNKPLVQLLAKGQQQEVFRDYLGFTLTHAELRTLYEHAEANSEWRARLSAVAGVYLILASTTGRQYVGSAYGANGVWGRWGAYAQNGHGGNAQLLDLIAKYAAYPASFTYSLLQILPRTATKAEVLGWERHYKRKLGSMATGLNSN